MYEDVTPFKNMNRVAVVILNWNGRKMLEQYLPSVCQTTLPFADVVVADNGSDDDSVVFLKEHFPDVKLLLFDKNYGYAEGYNKAVEIMTSEYVVLLNSDVETSYGWIEPMLSYMDSHEEVVACQPKILSYLERDKFEYAGASGGFLDAYRFPYCRGRIFSKTEVDNGQYDDITRIFWASGAAMFIRRKEYLNAGGLDKTFFAHMEEIDLCWRLNSRGGVLVCIPQSKVYHLGGGTLNTNHPRKTYLNFRNNLLMIYKNESEENLNRVMLTRKVLDNIAGIQFLLKGDLKNFKAVRKARKDFKSMKPQYVASRELNLKMQKHREFDFNYEKSIVWNFYARGIDTYQKMKNK